MIPERLKETGQFFADTSFDDLVEFHRLSENLFHQGNLMVVVRQFDIAVEKYTESLKYYPIRVSAWHNRAIAFENLNKGTEALLDREVASFLEQDGFMIENDNGSSIYIKE